MVELFNITGQKVSEISNKPFVAGTHPISLDASGLPGGIYFYTVTAGNESVTKKLIVE